MLFTQQLRQFRKQRKGDLDTLVNQFPLNYLDFVEAQRGMSSYFHHVAKYKWVDAIQKTVMKYIQDDFNVAQGSGMTEDDIDPSLLRILFQLKLYMQTVVFENFQTALKEYMSFLLAFILRDPDLKSSELIQEMKMDSWI